MSSKLKPVLRVWYARVCPVNIYSCCQRSSVVLFCGFPLSLRKMYYKKARESVAVTSVGKVMHFPSSHYVCSKQHWRHFRCPLQDNYSMVLSPKNMYRSRREGDQLSSLIEPIFALESRNKDDSALSAECTVLYTVHCAVCSVLYTDRKLSVKIYISMNICWWGGVKFIFHKIVNDIWFSIHPIKKYSWTFQYFSNSEIMCTEVHSRVIFGSIKEAVSRDFWHFFSH